MQTYRSLQTIQAVQFQGDSIPGVTCDAAHPDKSVAAAAKMEHGCTATAGQFPHVHTQATGGLTVLRKGDWIYPLPGGPWGVANDTRFRQSWEVPATAAFPAPVPSVPVEVAVAPANVAPVSASVPTVSTPISTVPPETAPSVTVPVPPGAPTEGSTGSGIFSGVRNLFQSTKNTPEEPSAE